MIYMPHLCKIAYGKSPSGKFFLSAILIFFLANLLQGRHIIGGDVRYICLGKSVSGDSVHYEVIFTMYRDSRSGGANFDNSVQFGIYSDQGNGIWNYVRRVTTFVEDILAIPANNNDPCIIVPPNLGVEKGVYSFEVWLPVINRDYMISYQRCCRNPTISNLFNPDATGAAFTITISPLAQSTCNSSPVFDDFPPVVLCANEPLSFNHSASDAENDQVVYEFCTPLASGGQQNTNNCQGVIPNPANCLPPYKTVNFLLPGFSFSKPMGGDPIVSVDPVSGIISGTPQIAGQFVVGVCIKEYRNGVLLTSTQRDFQFNVQHCGRVVTPKIETSFVDKDTFIFKSCEPGLISFNNLSLGGTNINSYDWEFLVDDELASFNTKNVKVEFTNRQTYYGKLILNKYVGCKDSAIVKVQIFPEIVADFDFQYDTCYAGPVQFINRSFTGASGPMTYDWQVDSLPVSDEEAPSILLDKTGKHHVRLEISDHNTCKDTLEKSINWQPVPSLIILEPDIREGCAPSLISFKNLSKPIDETYKINWSFTTGDSSRLFQPQINFTEPGSYDVELEIISPIGCITKKYFQNAITIRPKPQAGFLISPDKIDVFTESVKATDLSSGANASIWFLQKEPVSFDIEPTFSIQDTGIQVLEQIVNNEWGCSDTAYQYLDVVPLVTMFMPDAFTPNKDGLNDSFVPVGFFNGLKSYECLIYNRWGDMIYESDNPLEGWEGSKNGVEAPLGTYLYQVSYKEPRGKPIVIKGSFELLR